MSIPFAEGRLPFNVGSKPAAQDPQSNSWLRPLNWLLTCSETVHQRAALRELADDPHLLRDLGLSREEALELANRPFWR
jgi:uncharacterized protein YjiS (DUF1127 family)